MESSYTTELTEKLDDLMGRRSFLRSQADELNAAAEELGGLDIDDLEKLQGIEATLDELADEISDTEYELDQSRVSDDYRARLED